MPTWNQIDAEIRDRIASGEDAGKVCDSVRQRHLRQLSDYVSAPVVAYYSGFLQKRATNGAPHPETAINDFDMNGFMAVFHNVPRDRGLYLLLHTPGGGTEATRAIVEYMYKMFGRDIRVIVPQLAMSAGTMIACAAREIVMGKHSSLGPADPQVNGGMPAMGVLHEIDKAIIEITANPARALVWQEVFKKYPPAFLAKCERAVAGTKAMVHGWLKSNMFDGDIDNEAKAAKVVEELVNFSNTTDHSHHFMIDYCIAIGLKLPS